MSGPRWIRVAPVGPFRVEMPVDTHQANLRIGAALPELLRGVDREEHGLGLALIRAVFFVLEFYHPFVIGGAYDEIAGLRHDISRDWGSKGQRQRIDDSS